MNSRAGNMMLSCLLLCCACSTNVAPIPQPCATLEKVDDADCISMLLGGDTTDDAGSPPVISDPVTFSMDIQPIFDKNCGHCHRVGGIAERLGIPLHLSSGESYHDLVDMPSTLNPELTLVTPGDLSHSLLYSIVAEDSPDAGLRMPLFDLPLSAEEIDLIGRWIEEGAAAN